MAAKGGAKGPEPAASDGAITFEDLGIPTGTGGMVRTPVGQRRSLKDVTTLEWIFLVLSTLSILVVSALTIFRLVELIRDSKSNVAQTTQTPTPSASASSEASDNETDTVFAILLLFNAVYILFYVLNGVFGERANELLIFVAGICIVLVYCIINYLQQGSTSHAVKLARLILISAAGPVLGIMALYIAYRYYDSRNLIFRTVGANIELQDMCQYMFLCESLLKFDFQLEVSIVILVLDDLSSISLFETLIICFGVTYGMIWAVVGFLSMRYENKHLTWIFFATSVFEPAYIIFKIVRVAQDFDPHNSSMQLLNYAIIVCSVLGLLVRVAVVLCMSKVYSNFGKGLKEKAFGDEGDGDTQPFRSS
ncbi:uncharacterized protein LOC100889110 isoform X2 [Strongylocentrotus purpuratus]|uniref:DUF7789 domain-containing protein n=1 Tax=Strongylocentrotus purpuratus TaxID=7668 RepID=A0A7M7NXA3_STRPU|nr:uncharacterized protein LOC100889110 isoform X1 [Strongylocentrotus purpuratus]XP_030842782.1 uncharacterized protein LOC100889110 isoform X2 [Strongylocentrotus purpuratus]